MNHRHQITLDAIEHAMSELRKEHGFAGHLVAIVVAGGDGTLEFLTQCTMPEEVRQLALRSLEDPENPWLEKGAPN